MAGGHLDAAAGSQMIDGKIHLRRIDHADIDDVGARCVHPLDEGFGQCRTMGSHVMADTNALGIGQPAIVSVQHRPQKLGRGMTDLPRRLFVQLIRINPANIVCLENCQGDF